MGTVAAANFSANIQLDLLIVWILSRTNFLDYGSGAAGGGPFTVLGGYEIHGEETPGTSWQERGSKHLQPCLLHPPLRHQVRRI